MDGSVLFLCVHWRDWGGVFKCMAHESNKPSEKQFWRSNKIQITSLGSKVLSIWLMKKCCLYAEITYCSPKHLHYKHSLYLILHKRDFITKHVHSICQKRRNTPFVHSPCLNCMWCLPSWLVSHCTVHIWITWVFFSHWGKATARCWLSVDTSNLFSLSPCVEQSGRAIDMSCSRAAPTIPLCVILKL